MRKSVQSDSGDSWLTACASDETLGESPSQALPSTGGIDYQATKVSGLKVQGSVGADGHTVTVAVAQG